MILNFRHRSKHSSSGSSSIAVIPQDNESNMENLQFDIDSRGSSISLSSGGSQQDIYQQKMSCNDMHENTNGYSEFPLCCNFSAIDLVLGILFMDNCFLIKNQMRTHLFSIFNSKKFLRLYSVCSNSIWIRTVKA